MPKKQRMTKEGYPESFDEAEDLVLKLPGEKLVCWKPEKVGETKVGKLMSITKTKFNPILRLATESGTVSIPVSTFLADIDFESYIGRKLFFEFAGKAGRNCRLFKVVLLK